MRFLMRNTKGAATIEFGLAAPLLLALSVGAAALGLRLDRYLGMRQVARAGAYLYSTGIDFSQTSTKELLLKGADGLQISVNSGDGVIYLSRVVQPASGPAVIDQRFVIGAPSVGESKIGSVAPGVSGIVSPPAVATLPGTVVLEGGERRYVVEVLHQTTDLSFTPFFQRGVMYSRVFF